jgi:hypothetical protein
VEEEIKVSEEKQKFTLSDLKEQENRCQEDIKKFMADINALNARLEQTKGTLNYVRFLKESFLFEETEGVIDAGQTN